MAGNTRRSAEATQDRPGSATGPSRLTGATQGGTPEPNVSIRVVVAHDHVMVRTALAALLRQEGQLMVVGESSTADAVMAVAECKPDVLVLATDQPDQAVLVVERVEPASPNTFVLLLTARPDAGPETRALELGARGVVSLDEPAPTLVKAITKIHAGEVWLDRARTAGLLNHRTRAASDPEKAKIASLTRRELEIVRLVGEGRRNAQIAEQLFISQATVRNHLTSILDKLSLVDRFDLAVYAFRHGLVRFP